MKKLVSSSTGWLYRHGLKNIFFRIDPQKVHVRLTGFGEKLGRHSFIRKQIHRSLAVNSPTLQQTVCGIEFANPIGLAAGFDYEARLTQILPAVGFGFQTIGTITNQAYGGNPAPMLGRLPRSRSLMVNKGFKNQGIAWTLKKLKGLPFHIPVGLSLGRSNLPTIDTVEKAIADIVTSFKAAEAATVPFAYYELNISCPNLTVPISFYQANNLNQLLSATDALDLTRPVFVKMPINETDDETRAMLKIISRHRLAGVIFGNLQKDRQHPTLDPNEVKKFSVGNFSGRPTQHRSDELIRLAYQEFGKNLTIIGCGGTFSAEDAYRKIRLGATLVQLITGLVFQGPQLVGEINAGLIKLLTREGFSHISEAIGVDSCQN